MTESWQDAFHKAQQLPPDAQDAIGALVLDEISDDEPWAQQFAASQEQLSKWAEKVRADVQAGRDLARSAYRRWMHNPYHPGLRFRCIHASEPIYSVRVGLGWRPLGIVQGDTVYWFWIGSHAEYDRIVSTL
ncbi:MAG: hypothetical protein U0795_24835 [Pirellulales bacterium]